MSGRDVRSSNRVRCASAPIAAGTLAAGILALGLEALAATPPAAHWRFEEGAPPALDASGNGNTGTVNGATYSALAPWIDISGNTRSMLFDSDADYVEVPAGPGTNLHSFANGITVEAVMKVAELPIPPDAAGQRIAYIVWADDDSYSLVLVSDATGRTLLRGAVNNVGGVTGPCSASVSAVYVNSATFSHVAMTYAAEVAELYIDGKLVDTGSSPAGCGSAVGPVGFRNLLRIGSDETAVGFPSNDRAFRGWLDEVRITGEALDPADFVRTGVSQLLVAVWSSTAIHRYDLATGVLDLSWFTFGVAPNDLEIGLGGALYITQQLSDHVGKYNRHTGSFGGVFASGSGMNNPLASRFGPDGHLYVNSQIPDQILRYDGTTGAFIDIFTTTAAAPLYHHFGPDGHLWVRQGADIVRYDGGTGALIGTFTSGGPASTGNAFVFGPDGDLYVTMGDAVSRFDGITGVYQGDLVASGSGGLDAAHGLAFGPAGDLFVASFFGQEILRYDGTTGAFIDVFASPGGQVRGLLFVPEPGVGVGLVAGAALLGGLSRRRLAAARRGPSPSAEPRDRARPPARAAAGPPHGRPV